MPERFPGMGVAQMQLHIGDRDTQQRIPQSNRCMRQSTGIDQDPLRLAHGLVNAVNQGSFEIALETIQNGSSLLGLSTQLCLDGGKGVLAIDPRLPLAQQIEIGAVQQQQMHGPKADLSSSDRIDPVLGGTPAGKFLRWFGSVPEWLMGADCKSAGSAYVGSNPTRPIHHKPL